MSLLSVLSRKPTRGPAAGDPPTSLVVLPPGPGGRPGLRLHAPGRSVRVHGNGFALSLGLRSRLLVVRAGRTSEVGQPHPTAAQALVRLRSQGAHVVAPLALCSVAASDAWVSTVVLPKGNVRREHRLAHDGYLFLVTSLIDPADGPDAAVLLEQVLQSWTWDEDLVPAG